MKKPTIKSKAKKEISKSEKVKELLKDYNTLPKHNNSKARQLRRKLRRLGYYLSKHQGGK